MTTTTAKAVPAKPFAYENYTSYCCKHKSTVSDPSYDIIMRVGGGKGELKKERAAVAPT